MPVDKDDAGASLLVEYMLTIIIAAILFSVLLLNLQSIIAKSDQIIMGEELDIAASIIANQLSDYSNELQLNEYTGDYSLAAYQVAASSASARQFDIPRPYSGKQYIVEIIPDNAAQRGKVKVIYASDPDIYTIATYNTQYPVDACTIICNTYNLEINFNPSANEISIKEV
ncbi:hypothetical protein [Methanocella sp. MCL-LM]|uniref:hypothetical protein n=1 Tax=Methanocella sp. MCL-LM TaxID=3412035 RepID=UPI003C7115AF